MFGMVQNGSQGIEQVITPPEDNEISDIASYGVDWNVNDDPSMTHLGGFTQ